MSQIFTLTGDSSKLSAHLYPHIDLNRSDNDGTYCLGLIGFQTWNSIPNIEDHINNTFTYGMGDKFKTISIPTGSYEITDITRLLESKVVSESKANVRGILSIKDNNNTLKCEIKCKYDIDFTSDDSIGRVLGFSKKILRANILHESDIPVDIVKVKSIRIECNITSSSYCNGVLTHTLYEFSPNVDPGYKIDIEPKNVIYLPVIARYIDNISLRIVDQDGRLVNFRGETITVRLELKQLK